MTESLHLVLEYLLSPSFFKGALTTLALTVVSMLIGMLIGLPLALLQERRSVFVRLPVLLYLWLFRGTPVLLQIVFVFNVLPLFGVVLSGFASGVLALALNEGAYMAEIFRSGIQAVSPRQRLAGRALGMTSAQVMRLVVLPQALRTVVPPTGNQFMGMLKSSALVSVIAVQDLLLIADQTASANFRYIEALSAAAIYYLIFTTLFMVIQGYIERWVAPRRSSGRRSWSQRLISLTSAQPRSSQ
ncbi:amino acid ABC transporter permease [Halotalea alkalilenta]|uniref:Polar amino acid ABC transporter permease n=1 Tax=Halotalea alkalilenta TaxID=376489 RepID=A0A172YI47_9GAMM|nr:amino acid ABC transporter permease [Halotalea alkalilenta]ANF58867.1 polar amino acid ABC transporter permease [Halotalea alkalilenta]